MSNGPGLFEIFWSAIAIGFGFRLGWLCAEEITKAANQFIDGFVRGFKRGWRETPRSEE